MSQRPIHQCQCEICQSPAAPCRQRGPPSHECLLSRLNEQHRRWYVALEAERIGHGGSERLAQITGMNVNTIRRGRRELNDDLAGRQPTGCASRAVGGQRWKKSPAIEDRIKEIVNDDIAGSPTDEQKWVKLSLRTIASRLRAQAYRIVAPQSVGCCASWALAWSPTARA